MQSKDIGGVESGCLSSITLSICRPAVGLDVASGQIESNSAAAAERERERALVMKGLVTSVRTA